MRKLPGVDHINIKENGIVVWIFIEVGNAGERTI
jgi:hypothetical protein